LVWWKNGDVVTGVGITWRVKRGAAAPPASSVGGVSHFSIRSRGLAVEELLRVAEHLRSIGVVAPMGSDLPVPDCAIDKGDVAICGNPFRVAWRNRFSVNKGFRIELSYPHSGERFGYVAPPEATSFVFPYEAWPRLAASKERCLQRKDYTVEVRAMTPEEQDLLGAVAVTVECAL
jgi:hypothetical protein